MNYKLPVLSFLFTESSKQTNEKASYLLRGVFIAVLANIVFIFLGLFIELGLTILSLFLLLPCVAAYLLIKKNQADMAIHVMSLGYSISFIGSPWLIGRTYSPILVYISIIFVANLVFQSRRVKMLYFLVTFLSIYAYVLANTYTLKPQLPYIELIEFGMLFFCILFIHNALSIFFKDIHVYKKKIKEREHFLDKIINTSPDAIFVKNNKRQFVLVNDKFTEIEGRSKEAFIGKTSLELDVSRKSDDIFAKEDKEIIRTSKPIVNRVVTGMENGEQLWFSYTKVPITNAKQNVIGILCTSRDITPQKRQEIAMNEKNIELQKYIESNMQLENFAHIASHDLKEPIRSIIGFSQLLKRKAKNKLNTDENEYLEFIIAASQNMAAQIEDLLEYALVNSKTPTFKTVYIPQLLDHVLKQLQTAIQSQKAHIKCQNIPEKIMCNSNQISQLFQNIISNGIKFSRPNVSSIISINAKEEPTYWQFSISDNGIGISPEYHEKIFLLFRRLHTRETYQGTGIGLAICKKIVDRHNGKIWIESEEGQGTTFHFTISKQLEH